MLRASPPLKTVTDSALTPTTSNGGKPEAHVGHIDDRPWIDPICTAGHGRHPRVRIVEANQVGLSRLHERPAIRTALETSDVPKELIPHFERP